ncbi:MAG TPA: hypothetical protein PK668_14295 [Myxococcota bacterium]|nr:hypothetical protein [Myxococcota bacterium]HRY93967.1 hypothetical protein [Myxococcota bacterium]HSA23709.1 hypothetical protein [Myxococcota bacterium]
MSQPADLPPPPAGPGVRRWRRLAGIAGLAVAAALVVATLNGARRHDVRLVVALDPAFRAGLERLVVEVLAEDGQGRFGHADLRFPDPPAAADPEHTFQLRTGRYRLEFSLYPRGAPAPVHAWRILDVTGAARVAFALP